ncbi:MAG TPA: metal-dependent hydrolase [Thermoanaerobaculia bacterium]|jgi:inner membrane protein
MDTLSHGLAGSVLSRAVTDRPEARAAFWVGAIAAMIPDLDVLFISSRIDYLRDHRSWTHSFLVLPFLALAIALVAKAFLRRTPLSMLWLVSSLGLASHIVFDWITSFGEMFWTPVSRHRYFLDWVFILDPVFSAIVISSLVLALVFRRRARRITAVGSLLLLLYIGFCALVHARALAAWRRVDSAPVGAKAAVMPQFLSPFRWLGLTDRGDAIDVAFFDVGPFAKGVDDPRPPRRWSEVLRSLSDFYPPPGRARVRRYEKPPPSPALAAAHELPDWKIYLAFARFPLETVQAEPNGDTSVSVQDLRFLPWFAGPWERDTDEGGFRRQPFVYRVRFDPTLRVLERGFVRTGRS